MPRTPRSTLFPYTTLFRSSLRNYLMRKGTRGLIPKITQGLELKNDPLPNRNQINKFHDVLWHLSMLSFQMEGYARIRRSEEHTSELQSRRDLVCRLLLEKK